MYLIQQFENEKELMQTIIYDYTYYLIFMVSCFLVITIIIYIDI